MNNKPLSVFLVIILVLTGCMIAGRIIDNNDAVESFGFETISQEEAAKMMQLDDGHIIVDVRRQEEYNKGHIPGAICIPVETITNAPPKQLPDFTQTILVYCRTGRRSKIAAQKLASMGFSMVYDFGGIVTWKGDVVKESKSE